MIDKIEELKSLNSEDSLIELTKYYFDKDDYKSSLVYVNKALDKANKRYYEIITLKINILEKLKMYIDALTLLNEELSMPYIPKDYETIFKDKYHAISSLFKVSDDNNALENMDDLSIGKLLNTTIDLEIINDILKLIDSKNARNYLDSIKEYLLSDKSNIVKTLLLLILNKQEVNAELKLKKDDLVIEVNPIFLDKLENITSYGKILNILDKLNTTHNITIEEVSKQLLETYILNTYPLDINEDEYVYLAASVYLYAQKSLCMGIKMDKVIKEYDLKANILEGYINIIEKLYNI